MRIAVARRTGRARSAPAPEVVVVERGQVVVDHAERVHELDRRRCGQQVVRIGADGLAGREAEHGPDPLAAAVEAVAHRVGQRAELVRERGAPARYVLDQVAVSASGATTSAASRRACSSSASTCFAISASSARMSIACVGILRRLEPLARLLEPLQQLLGALEGLFGRAHATCSRAIRPRIPFTSRPASSDA